MNPPWGTQAIVTLLVDVNTVEVTVLVKTSDEVEKKMSLRTLGPRMLDKKELDSGCCCWNVKKHADIILNLTTSFFPTSFVLSYEMLFSVQGKPSCQTTFSKLRLRVNSDRPEILPVKWYKLLIPSFQDRIWCDSGMTTVYNKLRLFGSRFRCDRQFLLILTEISSTCFSCFSTELGWICLSTSSIPTRGESSMALRFVHGGETAGKTAGSTKQAVTMLTMDVDVVVVLVVVCGKGAYMMIIRPT